MLFGRRKQIVKRILIVEDEPLTAFDNENFLGDAGYEIVATVDDLDEALRVLEREEVHLVLSDVRLRKQQTGIHLAKAAKERGVPTLFATGHAYPGAAEIAIGCLMKPFTAEDIHRSLAAAEDIMRGREALRPKMPVNLTLYDKVDEEGAEPQPGFIPSKRSLKTRLEHWIAGTQH